MPAGTASQVQDSIAFLVLEYPDYFGHIFVRFQENSAFPGKDLTPGIR